MYNSGHSDTGCKICTIPSEPFFTRHFIFHLCRQFVYIVNEVCGTGKDGRVLKEDVLNFVVTKGICKTPFAILHSDKYDRPLEDRYFPSGDSKERW